MASRPPTPITGRMDRAKLAMPSPSCPDVPVSFVKPLSTLARFFCMFCAVASIVALDDLRRASNCAESIVSVPERFATDVMVYFSVLRLRGG